MRIAQVSPLHESVPPRLYGGTERVVAYLTDELVRQGHDVTLFASGDSRTRARLIPGCDAALRLGGGWPEPALPHLVMIERVYQRAHEEGGFDAIHFHTDYLHYPLARRSSIPHLTTLHGRLDRPDLPHLYREYGDLPHIAISDSQRAALPWLNWLGTVHHGLPPGLYAPGRGGDYLAFVGRISRDKGPDRAIHIARAAGIELRIAAKVDEQDRQYFEHVIRPLLNGPGVVFLGEISEHRKAEFLGRARALLFPINWPEPFGLVMIEAMACGTPVIATRCGSVPEIVEHGVSGFIVDSDEEAVHAARHVGSLSRRRCREYFDARFTVGRMARDYVRIYEQLAARRPRRPSMMHPRAGVRERVGEAV